MDKITINVNGKASEAVKDCTLMTYLEEHKMVLSSLIVAINDEVIAKNNYSSYILKENDKIELLSLVGGG
jgi:sulfur carrier protein